MNAQLNTNLYKMAACLTLVFGVVAGLNSTGYSAALPAISPAMSQQEDDSYRAKGSSVEFRAWLEPSQVKPGETATLNIVGTPDDNWHLYGYSESVDGPAKGYMPTLLHLSKVGALAVGAAEAKPAAVPEKGKPVHHKPVTWSIELTVPADAETGEIAIEGGIGFQVCDPNMCERPLAAKFAVTLQVADERGSDKASVTISKGGSYNKLKKAIKKQAESANESTENGAGEKKNSQPQSSIEPLADTPYVSAIKSVSHAGPQEETYRASGGHAEFSAQLESTTVKPGETATLFIEATSDFGWHVYGHSSTPGKDGDPKPTIFGFSELSGVEIGTITPSSEAEHRHGVPIHEGTVTWAIELKVPADAEIGTKTIEGGLAYLVCDAGGCDRPAAAKFSFQLVIGDQRIDQSAVVMLAKSSYKKIETALNGGVEIVKQSAAHSDSPEEIAEMAKLYHPEEPLNYETLDGKSGQTTFWAAMLGAFFGGALLNLMPCVFPVLGLKVLGFVEMADNDARKIRMHGLAFSAGLVVSMWVLAGAILYVKFALGKEISWGAQMGSSYFVGGVVMLLFLLGLNLTGMFEIGLFMTRVSAGGGKDKGSKGYGGSFFSGILTTLVATPCSGPFLGAAMGYTLSQTAGVAMVLFTVFGLGISSPYLVLSFFPGLIRMLPRPGAWMETFKKLMAFTLFAAAAFFVKTFGVQTGVEGLSWYLMALCILSLACFFYGKWSPAYISFGKRFVWGWTVPLLIAGLGIWMFLDAAALKAPKTAAENSWHPGKVEKLLSEQKIVWVDYTADW